MRVKNVLARIFVLASIIMLRIESEDRLHPSVLLVGIYRIRSAF
jgi:hypothetical protein